MHQGGWALFPGARVKEGAGLGGQEWGQKVVVAITAQAFSWTSSLVYRGPLGARGAGTTLQRGWG